MAQEPTNGRHVNGGNQTTEPLAGAGGGTALATAAAPVMSREQRLAEIVRRGSIQDLRIQPTDKVNTWPHLLVIEFVAALLVFTFVLIFSIFVNAPLQELANPNQTPPSAKAPWYFIGLQELLEYFTPMVAGILVPSTALVMLILTPYIDRNPNQRPEQRKFAVSLFTFFLMFWAVLTISGAIFRGNGFQWVIPWKQGVVFDL